MRPQKNKLAPATGSGRIKNFFFNLLIAAGWLVKSAAKFLMRVLLRRK